MDAWAWIDRSFDVLLHSGALDRSLQKWQTRASVPADVQDLIRICRDPDLVGSRSQKDDVHVSLCLAATSHHDECAATLLCWLFLPGLTRLLRELRPRTEMEQEDLAAELLAGFWDAATKISEDSRFVARALLTGARRRAVRAMRARSRCSVDEQVIEDASDANPVEGAIDDRVSRAVAEGVIDPVGASLLFATRATIGEMAARYHLSIPAAQQVRHRARQRVTTWLKDS